MLLVEVSTAFVQRFLQILTADFTSLRVVVQYSIIYSLAKQGWRGHETNKMYRYVVVDYSCFPLPEFPLQASYLAPQLEPERPSLCCIHDGLLLRHPTAAIAMVPSSPSSTQRAGY